MMFFRIGTRGSQLALWQAYFVENALKQAGCQTEIVIIETKGDKIMDRSLSKIGSKGVFTEELEEQLRNNSIDIAVHSAKDLSATLPNDLEIIAFTEREAVNDVLVSSNTSLMLNENSSFTIGTSSTRRVAMLRRFFPKINIVDMRGNVQTRLRKMNDGACDALLLAYAGVHRMGYHSLISYTLPVHISTPAVGQGSVAIECATLLANNKKELLRQCLNHSHTEVCLLAERAFLRTLQGGCSIPVFGLAIYEQQNIRLTGGVISLDGSQLVQDSQINIPENSIALGEAVAQEILKKGGGKILDSIKRQQ